MNPDNLARYYDKYDRMDYGNDLWTRMVASVDDEATRQRLLPFQYSCGRYVNEAGNRIELKFQSLSPALLQAASGDPQEKRWLQDEFLRRLLSEEMKQCPVDGIICANVLRDLVTQQPRGANRLVQTVYALVQQCT